MANSLITKVELIISCRNLRDADILSKSDPMVVLFIKHGSKDFIEFSRTEIVMNNLNPDFNKGFLIDYYFEEIQQLKFKVFDIDSRSTALCDHDFLGEYLCNLGELVSHANIEVNLTGPRARGKILIRCSEIESCKELFTFTFQAMEIPKRNKLLLFSASPNPYLEIYRGSSGYQFTGEEIGNIPQMQFLLAHRTDHVTRSENPHWKTFQVRNWRLCQGDRDRLLRIDCLNWRSNGNCTLIGSFYTSINDLAQHRGYINHFKLMRNRRNHMNSVIDNVGYVSLMDFKVETEYTFIDFISGGTQLHFTVAVDFTASNGPPNNPQSLHYIHNDSSYSKLNQYELAITSVGSIIEDYDYDKMFPALGFGAKIPPKMELSHCFPMSFQLQNPYCYRVQGLLEAYRHCLRQVNLFGPTNFAPCIRHVQRCAERHCDGSQYFVLLIITDGIITDIDKTVASIVDCSFLPISIIIVGVGDEDFSAMNMLDCDNGLLRSGLKVAERDIVQFVPLRDFISGKESITSQANLARAVLAELPDQLILWMRKHKITPKSASHDNRHPHSMPPPLPLILQPGFSGPPHVQNASSAPYPCQPPPYSPY